MERALRHSGFVARAEKKNRKLLMTFWAALQFDPRWQDVYADRRGCEVRPQRRWTCFPAALWTLGGSCVLERSDGGGDCVTCSSFNHRADQTSDTDVNETRSRLLLSRRARSVGKPFPFLSETTHRGWSTCVTINVRVYYDCYGCLAVIFQNKMQVFDGFSFSNVKKMSLFLVLHYSKLSFFKFWTICWTKEDFL